jgi:ABC-type polysaccharide/polyol phosphate export permease
MQAVQLAMLVFLGSTIFGDFFLPIEQIWAPVRTVSYFFPVTHGTMGLRDVMLRGVAPSPVALVGPLLLGLLSYALAARSIRREMATA